MNHWEEHIDVNPSQMTFMLLQAKNKYVIYPRGTGKSFIAGAEIDENVRLMPRGITSLCQATIGQALTKTLPSTFKMLGMLGYQQYDFRTGRGDYVVCRQPPEGFLRPYEHIMDFSNCITFSNGHCLYILTQNGNSRGPSVDYNVTDEALTIDKEKFDKEVAPTNRGNEYVFGRKAKTPIPKHHGNTFLSSMPYLSTQKWLLDAADYYERERGIHLIEEWNAIVNLQLRLIMAKEADDQAAFVEIWNEIARARKKITPFVSKEKTLFLLGSIFDNLANVGLSYIMNQYKIMDRMSFMIEMLNYAVEKVDNCYYKLEDRHVYHNATNDAYIRDFSENVDYDVNKMDKTSSRMDLDCDPRQPLEIVTDWGSRASFLQVIQERDYDFFFNRRVDKAQCFINEFYAVREEEEDTIVTALAKKFAHYYEAHINKRVILYIDRYGNVRLASAKKSYNEMFIQQLQRLGWKVETRVHQGIEPPQHDKFLLIMNILAERDDAFPIVRINGDKCRYSLISMNATRVVEKQGKFEKDKRTERNQSISPLESTHFGDCFDKILWTKFSHLINRQHTFVDARV